MLELAEEAEKKRKGVQNGRSGLGERNGTGVQGTGNIKMTAWEGCVEIPYQRL
jgi:hypothetical protein